MGDRVIGDKKNQEIGLLQIKCPYNMRPLSIQRSITDETFYIALNRHKKIFKEGTSLWLLDPNSSRNGTTWVKMVSICHFVAYINRGIITVKADFDKDYFKFVAEKINNYYKCYYINEYLSRANSE